MSVPSPITHFRVEGVFGTSAATPVEEWSFGFWLGGAALPAGYLASLPAAWTAVASYISNATSGVSFTGDVWLTEVMAAAIMPDGSVDGGTYTRYSSTPVSGTVSGINTEFSVSTAVTLDAGAPAMGRFNRFYPPPQSNTLTLGQITAAAALARATAARNMIQGVAAGFTFAYVVDPDYSEFWTGRSTSYATFQPVVSSGTYTTQRPIANVRVGRVPDTQRRRRRSLPEGYQSLIYPYP